MDFAQAVDAIRRRFADLLSLGSPFEPPGSASERLDGIEEQLATHRSGLFLGLYDDAEAARALERRGVLPAVRAKIGADCRVRVYPEDDLLRVWRADRPEGPDALVAEVKARFAPGEAPAGAGDALRIEWMLLQNPGRPFPPGRRPLPGQAHPGLGIGPLVVRTVEAAAQRLGAAAVIAIPAYWHNALLYRRVFAFVDPVEEGRFQALTRDLSGLPLAEAAWAVHEGRVRDATFGGVFQWRGAPMVLPLAGAARAYLQGPAYVDAAARTLLASRFEVASAP